MIPEFEDQGYLPTGVDSRGLYHALNRGFGDCSCPRGRLVWGDGSF